MRRIPRKVTLLLGVAVVLVLITTVSFLYLMLNPNNPDPLSGNTFFTRGYKAYYAFGGSFSKAVTLSRPYRLTGAFNTNSSVVFYVMTSQQYESQKFEFKSPVASYYSTGNVKAADINTTLASGDYDLVFRFVNNTGRVVTFSNGTGWVSTTAFTITQTFALTPLSPSTKPVSSQTSLDTTFTTRFYYSISINYSGAWNLAYWGQNETVTQYNVKGNLNGSGDYRMTVTTYGVGYVENTLCAKATKLDSTTLKLTLTLADRTNSTSTSTPSAQVCVTFAV